MMCRHGKQIWSRSCSKLTKHMTHEKLGVSAVNLPGACTSTRGSPKAQPIAKQDWLQHFQAVQRASECSSSAAQPACLDNSCLPGSFPSLFQSEFGQQALATEAGRLQKARATPRGALPVEVWCLPAITRKRTLAARQAVDAAL